MTKVRLKGGSLSGTYLCTPQIGEPFVRKEASLIENREYGFQRWYSQLKRMQRYEVLFPGRFPKLLNYGRKGDVAYFDMAYIPDAITVHEFLLRTTDFAKIDVMFDVLIKVIDELHSVVIPSTISPIDLYIYEEIEQKLRACSKNVRFQEIAKYQKLNFNGCLVTGLTHAMHDFVNLTSQHYHNMSETFSHGNLTLENILYQPERDVITLIDPYEENIVDAAIADYSQILQSCNSNYELYNAGAPLAIGNKISLNIPTYSGLEYFRDKFWTFLYDRCPKDIIAIRLFEVSQYARMLPFKMEIDEEKMVFFYALGSYLFHRLREDVS